MEFVDNKTPSTYVDYFMNASPAEAARYSDYSALGDRSYEQLNNFLTMYYQNAYNSAMVNYQNQYNSPLQQMLRYQEAGLNPFLAANEPGNMGSSPSGAAPRGSFSSPTKAQMMQAQSAVVNQAINSLNNTLKTAQSIYDYINYGRPLQQINLGTAGIQQNIAGLNEQLAGYNVDVARSNATIKDAEAAWAEYWNLGHDLPGEDIAGAPRARYMEQSTQRISAQIEQLNALVNVLYPSQAQRNAAGSALSMLQKQVLDGQKGAILSINTGNDTADAILKMVCFWLLNK